MKNIITVLTILLCIHINAISQTKLLDEFDFSDGSYTLIIRSSDHPDANDYLVSGFIAKYIDDINVLNELKSKLLVTEGMIFGYFDYYIYICKSGIIVKSFAVRLPYEGSNIVLTGSNAFYFNFNLSSFLFKNIKASFYTNKNFESLLVGRKYYDDIIQNDSLIFISKPDWLFYTGTFEFVCKKYNKDLTIEEIRDTIKNNYPNEQFELRTVVTSKDHINVEIKCNKSLFNNFILYSITRQWNEYKPPFNIESYWRK